MIAKILKISGVFLLILNFAAGQIIFVSGYEAHVINVTARICQPGETRTIGFWKNHEEIYSGLLPQNLGSEIISTPDQADYIFKNASARSILDMLKAQLLAMKFNIAYFGIGEYLAESEGETLNKIVSEADYMAENWQDFSRQELEKMKDLLDGLNNLHQIRFCASLTSAPTITPALIPASSLCEGKNKNECGDSESDSSYAGVVSDSTVGIQSNANDIIDTPPQTAIPAEEAPSAILEQPPVGDEALTAPNAAENSGDQIILEGKDLILPETPAENSVSIETGENTNMNETTDNSVSAAPASIPEEAPLPLPEQTPAPSPESAPAPLADAPPTI